VVPELAEDFRRGPPPAALGGRYPEAPPGTAQRTGDQGGPDAGGSEVVVVDQRQVHLVIGQQAECLTRLVLIDVQAHRGMPVGQQLCGRQQELPDARGERRHPDGAGRHRRRIQVMARGLEGGEDRDRVIG
jgi:hypothetical protein